MNDDAFCENGNPPILSAPAANIKIHVSVIVVFLFFFKSSFSCQCPTPSPMNRELGKKYDVIFFGKVDSVGSYTKEGISTAYFTITQLYKGAVEHQVKIDFDCASDCMMSFSTGEDWIIYAIFQRFNLITVNICGHSRKFFPAASQDTYHIASKRTFEEEKQFLLNTFGVQPFMKSNKLNQQQNELGPRNEQPSAINKLWLLLISIMAMIIVYYVSRNKKKNGQ